MATRRSARKSKSKPRKGARKTKTAKKRKTRAPARKRKVARKTSRTKSRPAAKKRARKPARASKPKKAQARKKKVSVPEMPAASERVAVVVRSKVFSLDDVGNLQGPVTPPKDDLFGHRETGRSPHIHSGSSDTQAPYGAQNLEEDE